MTVEAAKKFAQAEGAAYTQANPDYYPCKKNFETIVSYLSAQGVIIPTRDCFAQAVTRLRHFNLLEERPVPAPEPVPVEQPQQIEPTEAPSSSDLVEGWDVVTGEPRQYTQRQIHAMSADQFRRAFKMWARADGDFRPKFTRGFYQ